MQERAIPHPYIQKELLSSIDAEATFTLIFETYYKRIYNYIHYRVNCHFTAEDLTSQVFEKTMNKINTYSPSKSPFEVWLFAIARNVVNDRLQQALQALHTRERNMLALKFGAELKNTEISQLMGITEDNVGVILYRTMKKLRKTLGSVELE